MTNQIDQKIREKFHLIDELFTPAIETRSILLEKAKRIAPKQIRDSASLAVIAGANQIIKTM